MFFISVLISYTIPDVTFMTSPEGPSRTMWDSNPGPKAQNLLTVRSLKSTCILQSDQILLIHLLDFLTQLLHFIRP